NREHRGPASGVEGRRAWHSDRAAPASIGLIDDKGVSGGAAVEGAARGAVPGRGTRNRADERVAAVQFRRTWHHECVAPASVRLADQECLLLAGAEGVVAAGDAVAARGA